jgi:orotidine 5'-phosphate decarboxylase subfamily 2
MTAPLERLRARVDALGAPLCLGLDPHPNELPEGLTPDVRGIERFARGILEAAVGEAVAVKINVAFFEAFGSAGWAALERVRRDVPADVVTVLDAKRGDIGPTAERYAEGLLGTLDADAVTLSPYLGEDAITPFLAHPNRLVYVLARTSNPSAGRLQELTVDGEQLHMRVARWVAATWTDGRVGLVVGATARAELKRLRETVPGPAFLVPGVGAQGGDLDAAVRACHGAWAPGLVPLSRAISGASRGPDWRAAAAVAARSLRSGMRDAVLHSTASATQRPITEAPN